MADLNDLKRDFHPVKIIKRLGDRKSAITEDNITVYRKPGLYTSQEFGVVKTAPYDNHFLFIDPGFERGVRGRSKLMCTCGSWAVIVGSKAYAKDASPSNKLESTHPGQMIVCWHHMSFGKHADGSS